MFLVERHEPAAKHILRAGDHDECLRVGCFGHHSQIVDLGHCQRAHQNGAFLPCVHSFACHCRDAASEFLDDLPGNLFGFIGNDDRKVLAAAMTWGKPGSEPLGPGLFFVMFLPVFPSKAGEDFAGCACHPNCSNCD